MLSVMRRRALTISSLHGFTVSTALLKLVVCGWTASLRLSYFKWKHIFNEWPRTRTRRITGVLDRSPPRGRQIDSQCKKISTRIWFRAMISRLIESICRIKATSPSIRDSRGLLPMRTQRAGIVNNRLQSLFQLLPLDWWTALFKALHQRPPYFSCPIGGNLWKLNLYFENFSLRTVLKLLNDRLSTKINELLKITLKKFWFEK